MHPSCAVCVFAKPPRLGTVKTRLAASLGENTAAELAQAFLCDTWSSVVRLPWAKAIVASTEATHLGLPGDPPVWLQGDGDLGQRLERIARRGLAEADLVIALGADTPGLPEHLLVQGFDALAQCDAVLGPTADGGFYLLGLRRCPIGLLADLVWSAPHTCDATRARLQDHGLSVQMLDPWFDVDRLPDLQLLESLIASGAIAAPATGALLAARGIGRG